MRGPAFPSPLSRPPRTRCPPAWSGGPHAVALALTFASHLARADVPDSPGRCSLACLLPPSSPPTTTRSRSRQPPAPALRRAPLALTGANLAGVSVGNRGRDLGPDHLGVSLMPRPHPVGRVRPRHRLVRCTLFQFPVDLDLRSRLTGGSRAR